MGTNRPDIIEILESEKEYYADQIRRVNVAIAALKGEIITAESYSSSSSQSQQIRKVRWTGEIRKIYNTGVELDLEQLRDRLAENGIVEALSDSGKNSIYSTISRLAGKGYLEKTGFGTYRKKKTRAKEIIDKIETKNKTDQKTNTDRVRRQKRVPSKINDETMRSALGDINNEE